MFFRRGGGDELMFSTALGVGCETCDMGDSHDQEEEKKEAEEKRRGREGSSLRPASSGAAPITPLHTPKPQTLFSPLKTCGSWLPTFWYSSKVWSTARLMSHSTLRRKEAPRPVRTADPVLRSVWSQTLGVRPGVVDQIVRVVKDFKQERPVSSRLH